MFWCFAGDCRGLNFRVCATAREAGVVYVASLQAIPQPCTAALQHLCAAETALHARNCLQHLYLMPSRTVCLLLRACNSLSSNGYACLHAGVLCYLRELEGSQSCELFAARQALLLLLVLPSMACTHQHICCCVAAPPAADKPMLCGSDSWNASHLHWYHLVPSGIITLCLLKNKQW
jgi:hypothetical protein